MDEQIKQIVNSLIKGDDALKENITTFCRTELVDYINAEDNYNKKRASLRGMLNNMLVHQAAKEANDAKIALELTKNELVKAVDQQVFKYLADIPSGQKLDYNVFISLVNNYQRVRQTYTANSDNISVDTYIDADIAAEKTFAIGEGYLAEKDNINKQKNNIQAVNNAFGENTTNFLQYLNECIKQQHDKGRVNIIRPSRFYAFCAVLLGAFLGFFTMTQLSNKMKEYAVNHYASPIIETIDVIVPAPVPVSIIEDIIPDAETADKKREVANLWDYEQKGQNVTRMYVNGLQRMPLDNDVSERLSNLIRETQLHVLSAQHVSAPSLRVGIGDSSAIVELGLEAVIFFPTEIKGYTFEQSAFLACSNYLLAANSFGDGSRYPDVISYRANDSDLNDDENNHYDYDLKLKQGNSSLFNASRISNFDDCPFLLNILPEYIAYEVQKAALQKNFFITTDKSVFTQPPSEPVQNLLNIAEIVGKREFNTAVLSPSPEFNMEQLIDAKTPFNGEDFMWYMHDILARGNYYENPDVKLGTYYIQQAASIATGDSEKILWEREFDADFFTNYRNENDPYRHKDSEDLVPKIPSPAVVQPAFIQ